MEHPKDFTALLPHMSANFINPNGDCQGYSKLLKTFLTMVLQRANFDPSLFTKKTDSTFTTLLIYVSDLILTGSHATELHFVKTHRHKQFSIKDLGDLHYFWV